MSDWFTVKIKYTKQLEDGTFKRVSEPYLVNAMSFTDAETRIYERLGQYIKGEFTVTGIARADYHDIFYYEDFDHFYKAKISFESGDDSQEGGKSKKVTQNFLITANSVKEAYERMGESMQGMMIDFTIPSISVSPIMDVFQFDDEIEELSATKTSKSEPLVETFQEHKLGTKTVFSASGSDDEEDFNDDDLSEEE